MSNKYTVQKIIVALIVLQVIFFATQLLKGLFPSIFGTSPIDIHLVDIGEFVVSIAVTFYYYTRIDKTIPSKYKDLVLNCIGAMIAVFLFFAVIRTFFL